MNEVSILNKRKERILKAVSLEKLGSEGFILQSGCDIPANARLENVKAMVAASTGHD